MSWLYVPGLAASNLESALPNLPPAASVTSKGKPMPPQSLRRAWKKGGYIRRLSGLILEPSILSLGVESWIASLRAIHANRTALPESAWEAKTIDGCLIASLPSWKPSGRIVSSAKTCLGMPMGNLPPSSRHWKEWATALRREYSARKKLAEAIGANGCSSWPTAKVTPGDYSYSKGDPNKPVMNLQGAARHWPTATANMATGAGSNGRDGGENLQTAVNAWPTPAARDHKGANGADHLESGTGRKHMDQLPNFVAHLWYTPNVPNGGRVMGKEASATGMLPDGTKRQVGLENQTRMWPTPQAIDANGMGREGRLKKDGNRNPDLPGSYRRDLKDSACQFSRPAQAIPDGPKSSATTRRLNPLFVEWLMGWPIGWTGCAPVEMASSQWLPQMRGYLWALHCALEAAEEPNLSLF